MSSASSDARQVLIPAAAIPRVSERLEASPHNIELLAWSSDGITTTGGTTVDDPKPEAAWLTMDLFFSGEFATMADTIVDLGCVQWVQGFLAGVDAPPFQNVMGAGIRLSNSDAPNIGVAEYVMSALLSHTHGIAERIDLHRSTTWKQGQWPELGGQTWLIVGFGSIGHEVAKRARPFGVEIVGARRTAVVDPLADRMVTIDSLADELATADAVVLACPLTDETLGMVNRDFLGAMRPDSVLVNVARGAVINDDDLIAALDAGNPGAAILDVFDPEPLPEGHPFWSNPAITVTSHIAGAGMGIGPRNDSLFLEQLDSYLAGRPLRLEVDS
ncbi:MAG: phosphoglycerate dehydrogenase-like enzyme [Acidimicrobiales bacterium]|jgi:phosphoglycerate dehydrogenase-like enzyme